MEEAMAERYWCHMCLQTVNPIMDVEIKCPFCQSGFVEEMGSGYSSNGTTRGVQDSDADFGTDQALSLWAPILFGMMSSPRRHRRSQRMGFREDDNDEDSGDDVNDGNDDHHHRPRLFGGETDLDRELESILRRRRSSSATILQLLQGLRAGIASEYGNPENALDWDRDRERERERASLVNPFHQAVVVQGSNNPNQTQNLAHLGSLGNYFTGPGLDLLLQHLAENDPNRHGTPPAQKEAIEALPTAKISDTLQCSVCLDDFEVGTGAKEMPCKHKFHSQCILPWLELHSSCPVCRYQLPAGESKIDSERSRNRNTEDNNNNTNNHNNSDYNSGSEEGGGEGRNGNGRRFSFPWPFNVLFSSASSGSQSGENNASSGSGSSRAYGN